MYIFVGWSPLCDSQTREALFECQSAITTRKLLAVTTVAAVGVVVVQVTVVVLLFEHKYQVPSSNSLILIVLPVAGMLLSVNVTESIFVGSLAFKV